MIALGLPLGFAVALLCGMAIPRGITAGVVAMVFALVLGGGAGSALVQVGMLPVWGLLVLPAAFLAVTWAWSGDWLLDRPAPGRWVRLGLILDRHAWRRSSPGTPAVRAWSIPDVGPIPPPSTWVAASAPLPPDRNAADLYREAGRLLDRDRPGSPSARSIPRTIDLDEHPEIFDLIRRAAARPDCRFFEPDRLNLLNGGDLPPMRELADAVIVDARDRLNRGDLAAAWDDIVVLFRMARHLSAGRDDDPGAPRRWRSRSRRSTWRWSGPTPRARRPTGSARRSRPIATCPG